MVSWSPPADVGAGPTTNYVVTYQAFRGRWLNDVETDLAQPDAAGSSPVVVTRPQDRERIPADRRGETHQHRQRDPPWSTDRTVEGHHRLRVPETRFAVDHAVLLYS